MLEIALIQFYLFLLRDFTFIVQTLQEGNVHLFYLPKAGRGWGEPQRVADLLLQR